MGLSTLLTAVDARTQKAADSALRLQAQYARLAQSQGNTAQASGILSNALLNNAGASERAVVSLSTQLTRVQQGTTAYQQFGQAASQGLLSMVGPAAAASAGIGALITVAKSFGDAFAFKANLDATTKSIQLQLQGVRDSNVVFAEGQQFAAKYGLTQQELTNTIQSSIGVMRASNATTTDLLETLSRLQVLAPEKPISEAARALRELQSGDTTSIKDLFNISAASANKMKAEILAGADAVAVLSKFLDQTGIGMDTLAARTEGAKGKMIELAQAQEQLKLAQAEFAQGPGLTILGEQIKATSGLTRLLSGDFSAMGQSIQATLAGSSAYNTVLAQGGTIAAAVAAQHAAYAAAIAASVPPAAAVVVATTAFGAAMDEVRTVTANATNATAQKAAADQLAAIDAQTAAVANQALAAQAQAAANALLRAGPAGAAAAAKLAGSSALVDILTAAYYRLANAKVVAAAAEPRPASFSDERGAIRAGVARDQIATAVAVAKSTDTKKLAEVNYQQTLGNTAPALARARAELGRLVEGSAAYINKQNDIAKLQIQAEANAKKASGGAGGGGTVGAARISDQTKLNNSLLANDVTADQKAEDAEKAHLGRLIAIQADFNKKSLAQQQANEISKRASQADFYDRLTSSDLNKKAEGTAALQAIDAQYQADYQKSQELAQAGKQKQAADLLALAQKQAQDELTFQENLSKAKDEKDKGEVSRLEAIHRLRQATADEERKQLLEGGDANVIAKDQALQDEITKNEEAHDKIGTAADRASQRQITAAIANGKAIDANQAKLKNYKDTYDGIAPGAAPLTPGAQAPAPAATPADPIAAAIEGMRAAINAVEGAVTSAGRGIEGAVGRMSGKFAA